MGRQIRRVGLGVVVVAVILAAAGGYYLNSKKAVRSGALTLQGLSEPVSIRFDAFAIPHIYAKNETDAYFALGYLHAQDRLFQMEMIRRLAKGELAEVLGPELVSTDTFFRTLRLKQFGKAYVARADTQTPAFKVSQAYIDGINQFIRTGPAPVEFDLLKIPKKKFALSDIICVAGYMAYSFASGFKTDPVLTFIRDELGDAYLEDLNYKLKSGPAIHLSKETHHSLTQMAGLVADIESRHSPVGFFEGSNAWAVRPELTASGKAILSGDPHIAHSCPSVWYEAHLVFPGGSMYGHFLAGIPVALLGYNQKVAWSLTMFLNDNLDLFAEKINPENPNQVWSDGKWTDLDIEHEKILVKGAKDVNLDVRISRHGPIINDSLDLLKTEKRPVAVSWGFHDFDNDMITSMYELSHIDTVFQAAPALEKLHAPGLNFVMADAKGNVGWWAVAKLAKRPAHVDPNFIQDGSDPSCDYEGFLPFSANPQFINPASGVIVSANHQPQDFGTGIVPGYYCPDNRALRIKALLEEKGKKLSVRDMQDIQLDTASAFYKSIAEKQVAILKTIPELQSKSISKAAFDQLARWDGFHRRDTRGAAIFYTLNYYLLEAAVKDELGQDRFKVILRTRIADTSLDKMLEVENSVWWDDVATPEKETRQQIVHKAWNKALDALKKVAGKDPEKWIWEDLHTVEYGHALGRKKPLDKLFNIGPFKCEGAREVPNYQGFHIGPPPFKAYLGPSTRRIFDFSDPSLSRGITPSGQSGYFLDPHYDDQAMMYILGKYRAQLTDEAQIKAATVSLLNLLPGRR